MVSAEQFLTDFCKDIVANPGERLTIVKGYTKLLELREQSLNNSNMNKSDTNEFDKKLYDIIEAGDRGPLVLDHEIKSAVQEIKNAFEEEGYIKPISSIGA